MTCRIFNIDTDYQYNRYKINVKRKTVRIQIHRVSQILTSTYILQILLGSKPHKKTPYKKGL